MKKVFLGLILVVGAAVCTWVYAKQAQKDTGPHTVMVLLEAKPGKEAEMKELLMGVVEPSRAEETCLGYHLHQDINNGSQFMLYETWTSQQDHAKQFEKPYIIELGQKLETILAKPYQVVFAKEL